MKVAGVYTIAFTVTNSQGLSASVNRTLVVEPVCPLGQILCSNKVNLCKSTEPIQRAHDRVMLHTFNAPMHARAVWAHTGLTYSSSAKSSGDTTDLLACVQA